MKASTAKEGKASSATAATPLLIATRSCPACRVVAEWLDGRGIRYEKVYADESPDIAQKYHIRSVPVMLIQHSDQDGKEEKLSGFFEIRDFFS